MENPPKSIEADPSSTPQASAKPAKEKKPRTPAQEAATAKALAAMTAARKAKAEKQIAKKEEVKKAKKVVEDKILKEDVGFVMKSDFDNMRNSFMKEIGELKALYGQQQSRAKEEKPVKAPERVVERVIERVPTPSAAPTKLTGTALLDKVFGFN